MAASRLQNYIEKYGPVAGPKLYHALQSRAAYIGSNLRRKRLIDDLTGTAPSKKRSARPARESNASLPLFEAETDH